MIKFSPSAMARLALATSFILAIVIQGHTLLRPMLITDDVAQHHVWLDAGNESGFHPNDPWVVTARLIQPNLTAALFQALHLFMPTLLVGKVLALLILALTGSLIFRLATCMSGARMGWIAMGLFFISDGWIGISGGFARSFAWPLVCGFLLASLQRRRGSAASCLFLGAALYPVVFVLLVPCHAFYAMHEHGTTVSWNWSRVLDMRALLRAHWLACLAVVAGGILAQTKSAELAHHPLIGPQATLAEIQSNPIYSSEGRIPLWPQQSLLPSMKWALQPWDKALLEPLNRHTARLSGGIGTFTQVLLGTAFALFPLLGFYLIMRNSRRNAWLLLALASSGVLTFYLAQLFLPKLYDSSRYLGWSLPVVAVVCCAAVVDGLLALLPLRNARYAGLAFLGVVLASRAPSIRGKGAEDFSHYAPLYAELAKIGKGEVIASFPRTSDLIPVLCNRSIFVSYESSHGIWFSRYRDLVIQRQEALLDALYSSNPQVVLDFCRSAEIKWLVIEDEYYQRDMPLGFYFAPFEERVKRLLRENPAPWLHGQARKFGRQIQQGVYVLGADQLYDAPQSNPR